MSGPAAALVTSISVVGLMVLVGRRAGWVDRPDGDLKPHRSPAVPLGGVGVWCGLVAGLAVAGDLPPGLLIAATLILAVGLVDDLVGLEPVPRILAALAAGGILGWNSGGFFGVMAGAVLAVVLVNAVNLWDGMDGLAASTGAVTGLAMSLLAEEVTGAVLAATLVGFLIWNLPPARAFLGDNGAYVTAIGFVSIALGPDGVWSLGLVALVGLPLVDLAATVLRRLRDRRPLFAGDRDHLYDRLCRRIGARATLILLAGIQIGWCGLVIVGWSAVGAVPTLVLAGAAGLAGACWAGLRGP